MKIIKNTKGNTILIVLIAIFVLLSIVLYLNKTIINEAKISRAKLNLKTSHYASESGVERVLYLFRKDNRTIAQILQNNSYNSGSLNNGSSYKIVPDSSYSPNIEIPLIQRNTTYSLTITDFLRSIRSFKISWGSSGNEVLNISIARYRNNRLEGYNFRQSYNHYVNSPLTANINISPRTGRVYKFELNPTSYDVNNVTLTFYSGANATGNIVNVLSTDAQRIKSIGNYLNSNNTVTSDFLINSEY